MSFENIQNDNPGYNLHVLDIFNEMRRSSIESTFICALMENYQRYEGIRDLMEMWFEETNIKERDKIVADLQDCLHDIENLSQKIFPYL